MINHSNENSFLDDANSPELNKQILGAVSEDFLKVTDHLKDVCYQIKARGFSDFPVIVATEVPTEIGQILFKKGEFENELEYRASMMEEFVQRSLIGIESEELFKEHYKNLEEYCCLFVIKAEIASFIFIPYPED